MLHAHVPALVRAARLQDRDRRLPGGRRGRHRRRRRSPSRAITPTATCAARSACTAWCASARSTPNARRQTAFAAVEVTPDIEDEIDIVVERQGHRDHDHARRRQGRAERQQGRDGGAPEALSERASSSCAAPSAASTRTARMAMKMLKAKLYELELQKREDRRGALRGRQRRRSPSGSQIRSYVLAPYQLVKDLRTEHETGNVDDVLDGDLDAFIEAYLIAAAGGTLKKGGRRAGGRRVSGEARKSGARRRLRERAACRPKRRSIAARKAKADARARARGEPVRERRDRARARRALTTLADVRAHPRRQRKATTASTTRTKVAASAAALPRRGSRARSCRSFGGWRVPAPARPHRRAAAARSSEAALGADYARLETSTSATSSRPRARSSRPRRGELSSSRRAFACSPRRCGRCPRSGTASQDVEKRYRQRYVDLVANPRGRRRVPRARSHRARAARVPRRARLPRGRDADAAHARRRRRRAALQDAPQRARHATSSCASRRSST